MTCSDQLLSGTTIKPWNCCVDDFRRYLRQGKCRDLISFHWIHVLVLNIPEIERRYERKLQITVAIEIYRKDCSRKKWKLCNKMENSSCEKTVLVLGNKSYVSKFSQTLWALKKTDEQLPKSECIVTAILLLIAYLIRDLKWIIWKICVIENSTAIFLGSQPRFHFWQQLDQMIGFFQFDESISEVFVCWESPRNHVPDKLSVLVKSYPLPIENILWMRFSSCSTWMVLNVNYLALQ